MKKLILFSLILSLGIIFTNCGGKKADETTKDSEKTEENKENENTEESEETSAPEITGNNSTPEGLSKAVFEALKSQDVANMEGLYPNSEVMQKAMEETDREISEEEAKETEERTKEDVVSSFEKLLKEAKEEGFDVNNITFVSSTIEKEREEDGFEMVQVKFVFNTGEQNLGVKYTAAKIDGKWYVVEKLRAVSAD